MTFQFNRLTIYDFDLFVLFFKYDFVFESKFALTEQAKVYLCKTACRRLVKDEPSIS